MNQIKKLTKPIISEIEKILNRGLDNVYLNTALKVFLVLYAALAAPQFPPKLAFLMDNIFVRIGVSFLIVFMALRDPGMALIIAVAFVISLQTANKLRLMNMDLSKALPGETSWLPSAQRENFAGDEPGDVGTKEEKPVDLSVSAEEAQSFPLPTRFQPPDKEDTISVSSDKVQSECERCNELINAGTCKIGVQ
uniref:Uncharacterized protein n=1 Tax=viral metagenome TaxID=1070528 RepID=A0A6C0B3J8_9ZZZZ